MFSSVISSLGADGSFVTATTADASVADRLNERLTSSATWKSVPGSSPDSLTKPARYRINRSSSGDALMEVAAPGGTTKPIGIRYRLYTERSRLNHVFASSMKFFTLAVPNSRTCIDEMDCVITDFNKPV